MKRFLQFHHADIQPAHPSLSHCWPRCASPSRPPRTRMAPLSAASGHCASADPRALCDRRRVPRIREEEHRAARRGGDGQRHLDDRSHRGHVHRGADRAAPHRGLGERIRRRPLQHVVLVRRGRAVDRAAGRGASRQRRRRRDPARRGAQLSPIRDPGLGGVDGRVQSSPRRPAAAHRRNRRLESSDHARRAVSRG